MPSRIVEVELSLRAFPGLNARIFGARDDQIALEELRLSLQVSSRYVHGGGAPGQRADLWNVIEIAVFPGRYLIGNRAQGIQHAGRKGSRHGDAVDPERLDDLCDIELKKTRVFRGHRLPRRSRHSNQGACGVTPWPEVEDRPS